MVKVKYVHVFLTNPRIFSHFLIISSYDFIVFDLIIISTMKLGHAVYIQSNIYKTKWFTFLESQIIGNLELFGLKTFLVLTLNTMGGILYGDIMSERSEI